MEMAFTGLGNDKPSRRSRAVLNLSSWRWSKLRSHHCGFRDVFDAYVIPEVMNEIMMNPNDVLVGVANQQLRLHSFREQRPRATLEILFIPVEVCEVVMNMMVGGGHPLNYGQPMYQNTCV